MSDELVPALERAGGKAATDDGVLVGSGVEIGFEFQQRSAIAEVGEGDDPQETGWWVAAEHGIVELAVAIDDALWLDTLQRVSLSTGVPLVAAGDVHMHVRSRKSLQDLITAVRVGKPVDQCGLALQASAERYLRPRVRLGGIYPPELLAATLQVADRCQFSLESIKYQYPLETVPAGMPRMSTVKAKAKKAVKKIARKVSKK